MERGGQSKQLDAGAQTSEYKKEHVAHRLLTWKSCLCGKVYGAMQGQIAG
jgi:hypothetical protein